MRYEKQYKQKTEKGHLSLISYLYHILTMANKYQ